MSLAAEGGVLALLRLLREKPLQTPHTLCDDSNERQAPRSAPPVYTATFSYLTKIIHRVNASDRGGKYPRLDGRNGWKTDVVTRSA
jgi:hypothetical protein